MKVKDAMAIVRSLKEDKMWYQTFIGDKPFHPLNEGAMKKIKTINREIARIEELIYNQELDDWNEEYE